MSTSAKPFFHLGNPAIEYSTDFDFFLRNQILTVESNEDYPTVNFSSRLESRWFDRIKNTMLDGRGVITAEQITAKCKEVHQKLMAGGFGTPTFID